jgi:hypothetical protein
MQTVPNARAQPPHVHFQEPSCGGEGGDMRRLSEQLHNAQLAPDAKSGNASGLLSPAPSAAAARPGLSRGSAYGAAAAGDSLADQAADAVESGSACEEIAETNPSAGLIGGFRDSTSSSSGASCSETWTSSESSGAAFPAGDYTGPSLPSLKEDTEAEQEQQEQPAAQKEAVPGVGNPGSPDAAVVAGITGSLHVDVGREDAGKGEDEMYADLDTLQETGSSAGLRDLSDSESLADAASLDRQQVPPPAPVGA